MRLTTREIVGILMVFGGFFIFTFYCFGMQVSTQKIEPGVGDIFKSLGYGSGLLMMMSGVSLGRHRAGIMLSVFAAGTVYISFIVSLGYFLGREQWMLAVVFAIFALVTAGSVVMVSRNTNP